MLFFLYGADTYRSRKKLNEIKEKFIHDVDESALNLTTVDGEKADINEFNRAVSTPPFLARKRLVVVENLIAKNKKIKKSAQGGSALGGDLADSAIEILNKKSEDKDLILVFWEGDEIDRRVALFKRLAKEKYAQEFELLKDREVVRWIQMEVKRRGGNMEPAAMEKLAQLVGNDLWQAAGEIDKLIGFAASAPIKVADVEALVKGKFDDNIFNFTDALGTRNFARATELLHDQLEAGAEPMYLLSMIIRQYRILIMTRELLDAGVNNSQTIAKELVLHPFVAKKSLEQARNYTLDSLKKIYGRLLEIDRKIKTTSIDPAVLFDLFVAQTTGK